MGQYTSIEWCDSTCNAQMGCGGCELWTPKVHHCYAGILTEKNAGMKGWPKDFGQPLTFPERIFEACKWPDLTGKDRKDAPWLNGLPRLIFLDDMGDTFTEGLQVDWIGPYIQHMQASPHIWIFLTKRPKRMKKFFAGGYIPGNFWLGVSVTDQQTANARIDDLLEIKEVVTLDEPVKFFLSVEPQLEPIDFRAWIGPDFLVNNQIDWFVNGGESGKSFRRFDWDWARRNRNYCEIANIPYFMKQGGGYPDKRSGLHKIPEDLRIREMPITPHVEPIEIDPQLSMF